MGVPPVLLNDGWKSAIGSAGKICFQAFCRRPLATIGRLEAVGQSSV
jgi:hypothetical protein